MSEVLHRYRRVLAIDPSRTGFGFVVLEDGRRLIDWGVARVWSHNDREFLGRIEALVERYQPALIVLEELLGSRRSGRAARRIRLVVAYTKTRRVRVRCVSRRVVRAAFAEAGSTKQDIANAIAAGYPELAYRLPPPRKPWMSEDERMSIFDAMSFIMALSEAGTASG